MLFLEVEGVTSIDDIKMGELTLKQVNFIEVIKEDGAPFKSSPFDGILGLGMKKTSVNSIKPVLQEFFDQELISDLSFSFFLTKDNQKTGSQLILGGIDDEYDEKEFNYHDVIADTYW